jgi:hypothetical protein
VIRYPRRVFRRQQTEHGASQKWSLAVETNSSNTGKGGLAASPCTGIGGLSALAVTVVEREDIDLRVDLCSCDRAMRRQVGGEWSMYAYNYYAVLKVRRTLMRLPSVTPIGFSPAATIPMRAAAHQRRSSEM